MLLVCLTMAVIEVFSEPELRKYRASIATKAFLVRVICVLLIFIPPVLIVFATGGMWQQLNTYNAQPKVNYMYQYMVILTTKTATATSFITSSTFTNYNQLQANNLGSPLVKTRENDFNGDGLNDQLDFELSMLLPVDAGDVIGVQLLLFFDYILQVYSYFEMQSMVYISYDSSVPGASLDVAGDLALSQKWPLGNNGIDNRYNYPVVDGTSISANTYRIQNILRSYNSRNVTTVLSNAYPVWITDPPQGSPFVIKATIDYPVQYGIIYYTGFWQMIKWGWVQYVSVLLIFWYVFDRVQRFIFQNQVVSTIIWRPFREKQW